MGGNISGAYALSSAGGGLLVLGGTSNISGFQVNGGTTTITGSVTTSNNVVYVGNSAGTNGTLVIENGASLALGGTMSDNVVIGRNTGVGMVVQNGGLFNYTETNEPDFHIGANGAATYDMNGGTLDLYQRGLAIGCFTTGSGTFNLSGGLVSVNHVWTNETTTSSIFNFSGGTLQATGNNTSFMGAGTYGNSLAAANVNAGGAFIDTNGFSITITQNLAGGGGLTKVGSGTLTLGGSNGYSGGTTINAGTWPSIRPRPCPPRARS